MGREWAGRRRLRQACGRRSVPFVLASSAGAASVIYRLLVLRVFMALAGRMPLPCACRRKGLFWGRCYTRECSGISAGSQRESKPSL